MGFIFDLEENKEKIEEFKGFIQENKEKKGALIPVLQEAQDKFGYLAKEIMEMISEDLDVPLSEIYGVATFYSQFSFVPRGENNISVCLGTACYVKGVEKVLEEIEEILDIESGGTTKDLKFSITPTRCIGECGIAPVININEDTYGDLKPEDMEEILEKYK